MKNGTFLYCLECDGLVKIGISSRPWHRIRKITNGRTITPKEIIGKEPKLIKVVCGTVVEEDDLHRDFADQRVVGEWFHSSVMRHESYRKIFSNRPDADAIVGNFRVVNIKDEIHTRLKSLAALSGTTLGKLVHRGCEHIADATEKALAKKEAPKK